MIVYPPSISTGVSRPDDRGDFRPSKRWRRHRSRRPSGWSKRASEWLHIVDIDGARTGEPANLDAIRQIANRFTVKIQAGGGIRDFDTAEAFAEAGASRIIVGTAAIEDPELIGRLVDRHADGMAVAVDARNG